VSLEPKEKKGAFPLAGWLFLAAMILSVTVLLLSRDRLLYVAPLPNIAVANGLELSAAYDEMAYRLADITSDGAAIPNLLIEKFPKGWHAGLTTSVKKSVFYRSLLPLVLAANNEVAEERALVLEAIKSRQSGQSLAKDAMGRVRGIAQRYRLPLDPGPLKTTQLNRLLIRVDQIPVSMALGQGAYESGYGTSRFATEGNALFGQWRWGKGMAPTGQRKNLGDYRIATFATPLGSVRGYFTNLNTHKAYRDFRVQRAHLRRNSKNKPLPGKELVKTLVSYSERGEAYVVSLTKMIGRNKLWSLDSAVLAKGEPRRLILGKGKQN